MPEKTLVCQDCHQEFTFTEGEQAFFQEKGFTPPVRCSDCRRRRKAEKMSGGGSDYSGGGGGSYGGGGGGYGGGGGKRSRGY